MRRWTPRLLALTLAGGLVSLLLGATRPNRSSPPLLGAGLLGNQTALVLRTVWDSPAEAAEFCTAMTRWANARFGASGNRRWSGQGQHAALRCQGARVALLSAPDPTTFQRLLAAIPSA